MDGRSLIAQVIREAARLGLAPWERLVLILAVALLLVLGKRGLEAVKLLTVEPQPIVDEGGRQPEGVTLKTDAEGNVYLPTDPENPGGGPTGGMG